MSIMVLRVLGVDNALHASRSVIEVLDLLLCIVKTNNLFFPRGVECGIESSSYSL